MSAQIGYSDGSGMYQHKVALAIGEVKHLRDVAEVVRWFSESLGCFRIFCTNNSNKPWLDDLQFLTYCTYANGIAALASANENTARAMASNLFLLARCVQSVIREPKQSDQEWITPLLDQNILGVLHIETRSAVDQEPFRQAIERLAVASPAFRELMGQFYIVQSQGTVAKAAL